jgi:hypothetical protein
MFHYITSAQMAQITPLSRMTLLLTYMLSGLLLSGGQGTADTEWCFGCYGNVYTVQCPALDIFSGPSIQFPLALIHCTKCFKIFTTFHLAAGTVDQ